MFSKKNKNNKSSRLLNEAASDFRKNIPAINNKKIKMLEGAERAKIKADELKQKQSEFLKIDLSKHDEIKNNLATENLVLSTTLIKTVQNEFSKGIDQILSDLDGLKKLLENIQDINDKLNKRKK